jgi:SGNH hydrolase-like domain, acetyltransferase AlgX
MMRKPVAIYILIFCILLSLPPLQMCFRFFKEVEIYGVNPPNKPQLTLKKWFNGKFQSAATTWFEKNSGFIGHFAKTYNQLIYHLFKEAPSAEGVIVGKDHYLYMDTYVVPWQGFALSNVKELSRIAERIKVLQEFLRKRGITFLMVIAPSKAEVYPEHIPNRFWVKGGSNTTNYYRILPYLQENHIQYVDGHQYFRELKAESPYPLFAVAGIHWSFFGACKMSQLIQSRLAPLMQKNLVDLNCDPVTLDTYPTGSDRDIAELMNLWTPELLTEFPTPHPVVSVVRERDIYKPNVLFVGDSFCWTLLDIAGRKVFRKIDFLIYNNSLYPYPSRSKAVKWPRNQDRLRELILSKDLLILEAVEPNLNQLGFGFVEDAIAALE